MISETGGQWTLKTESTLKSSTYDFTPGTEFDEVRLDGESVKVSGKEMHPERRFNIDVFCLVVDQLRQRQMGAHNARQERKRINSDTFGRWSRTSANCKTINDSLRRVKHAFLLVGNESRQCYSSPNVQTRQLNLFQGRRPRKRARRTSLSARSFASFVFHRPLSFILTLFR